MRPPPRLFGIPARDAPVVAVLRRGPADWAHAGRWDVDALTYEGGSWLRGTLYPQRCDLSPDGRYLCYVALNPHARWSAGWTYVAVSHAPWLTALAAWGTDGTWTRGLHFVDDRESWPLEQPDEGDVAPLRRRFGLAYTRPASYAVERRNGWVESDDSPPFDPHDMWDERRVERVVMQKPSPRDGRLLSVRGGEAAFRSGPARWWQPPLYAIDDEVLVDAQWADWTADGRLLVATADGRLQVHDGTALTWEHDLAGLEPDPQPPPPEATRW